MVKKSKFILILLILIAILSVAVLTSCSSVDVEEIKLSEDSNPKTEYIIGEELNIENIFIDVVRTDMKVTTYSLIENLGLFTVSNFSSVSEATNLPIIIRYKNVQVTYHINVHSAQSVDNLRALKLNMGLEEEIDVELQKPFGSVVDENEIGSYVPTREGYIFDGWYKEPELINEFNFFADRIYDATNLYVKWAKIHRVRFLIRPEDDEKNMYSENIYPSGGIDYRVVAEYSGVKDGASIESPPKVPDRVGKKGSWVPGLFVDIDGDINAIANYSDLYFKASFKYKKPEGGHEECGTITNIPYGANLKEIKEDQIRTFTAGLPDTYPQIEFFKEIDWEIAWDSEGTGTSLDNIRRDTEFFAIPKIRKIKVDFNLNYAVEPVIYTTQTVDYSRMIVRPANPTRPGYAFKGWYKDSETTEAWNFNSEQLLSQGNEVIVTKVLYAKWVKLHKVEFFYQPNGVADGDVFTPYNIFENNTKHFEYKEFGTNYNLPSPPEIIGHNVQWNSQTPVLIDGDKQFKTTVQKKVYEVIFYDAEGTMVDEPQHIEYLDSAIPPGVEPLKYGYDFVGYSDDYNNVSSNLHLHPVFTPLSVGVQFDFGYGGHEVSSSAYFGRAISEVEPSEYKNREGYNFIGWTKTQGTNVAENIHLPIESLENIRLYAIWKQRFTLTFNNFQEAGNYSILTVEEGTVVNVLHIPNAEQVARNNQEAYGTYAIGYNFVWLNEEEVNVEQILQNPINSSHIFDVTPQLKKYKIEFLIDGSKDKIDYKLIEHGKTLSTISDFPTYATINEKIDPNKYEEFTTDNVWKFRGHEYSYLDLLNRVITSDAVIEPKLVIKTFLVQWKETADSAGNIYEAYVPYNNKAIYGGEPIVKEGYTFDFWSVLKPGNIRAGKAESETITNHVTRNDIILLPEFIISKFEVHFIDGHNRAPLKNFQNQNIVEEIDYGGYSNVDAQISANEESLDKEGKLYTGWNILSGQRGISISRYHNVVEDVRYWQLKHDLIIDGTIKEINSVLIIYKGKFYTLPEGQIGNLDICLNSIEQYLPTAEYSSIPNNQRLISIIKETDGWKFLAGGNVSETHSVQFVRFIGAESNKNLYFIVEDETVFEASYDEVIFTVAFDMSGEAITNPTEFVNKRVRYNRPLPKPKDPISINSATRIFLGWYTDASFVNRWADFTQAVKHDMTLYAKWDDITNGTIGAATYSLDANSNYAIVTSIDPNKVDLEGGIELANYYEGKPVKEIADYAFANGKNVVTSVILPNTLELIGTKAFEGLTLLQHIVIPSMVQSIGVGAFDNCVSLRSVKFGVGSELKVIGAMAFYNAISLRYSSDVEDEFFKLPSNLEIIGEYAFYGCELLKGVTIPSKVQAIGNSAFENCSHLSYVFIDTIAVPGIGSNIFRSQSQQNNAFKVYVNGSILTDYKSNQSWQPYASKVYSNEFIYYKESKPEWSYIITEVDGVDCISLLQYLGNDTEIVVPFELEGLYLPVNMISSYAFGLGIEKIEIGLEILTDINTFSSANNLKNIRVKFSSLRRLTAASLIEAYRLPDINKIEVATNTPLNNLFDSGSNIPTNIQEVEIYSSFTGISDSFFQDCDFVKKVIFYTTAMTIGKEAFANMRSLEEIVIHEKKDNEGIISTVQNIGDGAFKNSYRLSSFKYSLGENFENLQDGIIPHAFNVGADILEGTAWINDYKGEVVVIGDKILYKYIGLSEEGEPLGFKRKYILPSDIKQIAQKAFMGVSNVESIIPENLNSSSLTFIGSKAFANMSSLEMVVFPNTASNLIVSEGVFEKSRKLSIIVWAASTTNGVLIENLGYYFGNYTDALPRDDASTGMQKSAIQLYYNKSKEANWATSSISKEVNFKAYANAQGLAYAVIDDEISWLYANVYISGESKKTLIKYLAESNNCVVPDRIGAESPFANYGGYVLSRKITSLDLKANILPFTNSFNGIYSLTDLSISGGTSSSHLKLIGNKVALMINTNPGITALSLNGIYAIESLLDNNPLNSRIKTINIVSGGIKIADKFLYDAANIKYINILSTKDGISYVTPLEELVEDKVAKGITFNEIGAKAFWGTEWIDRYEGDYIVVLDRFLIDYKGSQSVLDFNNVMVGNTPISISAISSGAFKNNTQIEALYIPITVSQIGDEAFRYASKLTKIFVLGEGTGVPAITSTVFADIGSNYSLYAMNSTILTNMDGTHWQNMSPELIPLQIIKEGEKWLSKQGGIAYLNVYISEYLIDVTDADYSVLKWQREYFRKYIVNSVVANLAYDLTSLELYEEIELDKIIVPRVLTNGSDTYTITEIGNNAFLNTVDEIGFRIDVKLNDNTFANIDSFSTLNLITKYLDNDNNWQNIDLANRHASQSNEILNTLIEGKGINKIVYFGNYKLDEFLEKDGERPSNITSVKISEGATETVDKMLSGWTGITSFEISKTVQKLGVLSLEDTAWYKNSADYVMAGHILYKYKGSLNDTRLNIPAATKIVNTGAFSKARESSTSWTTKNDWDKLNLSVNTINFSLTSQATTILDFAFAYCSNLNTLNAPISLSKISANAFEGTPVFVQNDFMYAVDEYQRLTLLKYSGTEETITLNSSVRIIADKAFENISQLVKITIPNGSILEYVGAEAFKGTNLSYFEYNENTTALRGIGKDAFPATSPLNKPDFLVRNGKKILYNQAEAQGTYFTIGENVISITENAIRGYSEIILENKSLVIPARELKSVLSNPTVKKFTSFGIYSLEELIGTSEPLDNIEEIAFKSGTLGIAPNFVNGWRKVKDISENNSGTIERIGNNAFTGTQYLVEREINAAEEGQGIALFGDSGILIAYSGGASVVLGATVKAMMPDVFRGNTFLESINLSESLIEEIPAYAFEYCTNLNNIVLPQTLEYIGEKAFDKTAWLNGQAEDLIVINGQLIAYKGGNNVIIDSSVKKINSYVFSGNSDIVSVTFASDNIIDYIEPFIFANCSSLETVVLNKNIERIAPTAFLNTIYYGRNRSIYYIENAQDSERLYKKLIATTRTGDYELDYQVTEIGKYAFNDSAQITGITIGQSSRLIFLPDGLFANCNNISRINITKTGLVFGKNLFNSSIPYFSTAQANSQGFVVIGNSYLLRYKGAATSVTIPKNIKYIGEHAFAQATQLTSVNFNQSLVKHIPDSLFANSSNLTAISLNESYVETIGKNAFSGTAFYNNLSSDDILGSLVKYNPAITDLILPSSVKYIPDSFFENSAITKVTINGPVVIGNRAFANCTSLTNVINAHHIISIGKDAFVGSKLYNEATGIVKVGNIIIGCKSNDTSITIDESVTRISSFAFSGNKNIKTLIFATRESTSPMLYIEDKAFRNCEELETVDFSQIASKISYLGSGSFDNTKYLKNLVAASSPHIVVDGVLLLLTYNPAILTINKNITRIVGGLAKNNYSIARLDVLPQLGASETYTLTIGENAFWNAFNLRTRNVETRANEIIENNAFRYTRWQTLKGKLVVSEKGQLIAYCPEEYEKTLLLTTLTNSIYPYVFKDNRALTTVDMRNSSMLNITTSVFDYCPNLTDIKWSLQINCIIKSAVENTVWYSNLPDAPYVYEHMLLFVKGATSNTYTLNDANIYRIKACSLDEFETLTFGANMSTNIENQLELDAGAIDHIDKITVPSNRLEYFKARFSLYAGKFISA